MENEQNIDPPGSNQAKPPTKKLSPECHPERSEGSGQQQDEILRCAQNDKRVHTKTALIVRIVAWIWAGALVLLLAAGIIVQVPWKVLALIVIFLIAATILPRRSRKWFWATVGVLILAYAVWVFLPNDTKGWRPYTFDKELAELQARYAVPDSENAAVIYNDLLRQWQNRESNEPPSSDSRWDKARWEPWLSQDYPEYAAWIEQNRDTIDGIVNAAAIERCMFTINGDPLGSAVIKRAPSMRRWAYLLVATGNNCLAEGRTSEALEKYIATVQMGKHLRQQSDAVDILVGLAVESLGLGQLDRFVVVDPNATEPYLARIKKIISNVEYNWSPTITRIIESDNLRGKNQFAMLAYQVNEKGQTRFTRDPWALFREQAKDLLKQRESYSPEEVKNLERTIYPGYWLRKYIKAYTVYWWFFYPRRPEILGKMVDEGYVKYRSMADPNFNWSDEPVKLRALLTGWNSTRMALDSRRAIHFAAQMAEETYHGLHSRYVRATAIKQAGQILVAMRRYKNTTGRWPEKLEDIANLLPPEVLIDPINCDSFVYKVTDDGFTLYSKGQNGVDDGGKREKISFPNSGEVLNKGSDDWLIWPPKQPCLTEEKNEK